MSDLQDLSIDYSLCILCQKFKNEKLQDPQFNGISSKNYETLQSILIEFNKITGLPNHIQHLIDGGDMAHSLFQNQAQWHKSCRIKYNDSSFTKLKKRLEANSAQIKECQMPTDIDYIESQVCIICQINEKQETLHGITKASTYDTLIEAAKKLQKNDLVGRLCMKTGNEKYHRDCFTDLFKKSKKLDNDATVESNVTKDAYTQLWSYIASTIRSNEDCIFTLCHLRNVFMGYLNITNNSEFRELFNSTRFKNYILKEFPSLREFKKGKEIFLAQDVAIANALSSQMQIFKESAKILRKSMFANSYHNNSNLLFQETSVSSDLLTFINYLLNGPNAEVKENSLPSQAVLSISQIIRYNSLEFPTESASKKRHTLGCETPLIRYVGLSLYLATKKKSLVEKFHKLGLCLSYARVLEINGNVANSICDVFEREKTVYPTNLQKGFFVTTAVDNIDHNRSSTTSVGSFHGTAISVNIHPNKNGILHDEELPIFSAGRSRKMKQLPYEYTYVEPISLLNSAKVNLPSTTCELNSNKSQELNRSFDELNSQTSSRNELLLPEHTSLEPILAINSGSANFPSSTNEVNSKNSQQFNWNSENNCQKKWLQEVENAIKCGTLKQYISWSAFHANKVRNKPVIVDKTGLLPLFNEQSTSPAMIRHALKIAINVTKFLNPEQKPVFTGDQPLFTIAKELQWLYPSEFGEDKLVLMFGGLHIEKTFLICIGDWLTGSEWNIALSNANIFTSGTAQSCLTSSHVTKTRMSHQITAAVLFILKRKAFNKEGIDESKYEQWEKASSCANPQFYYWNTVLHLELLLFDFVKSIRERDFELYVSSLERMIPWFFALDHYHYARWISVHIRDLRNLKEMHPEIYKSFKEGKFVFQKTNRCFSAMALDQCHEQHNAKIKGDGGAIGAIGRNNSSALLRWMVAGPEISRIVVEFGEKYGLTDTDEVNTLHHDMTKASQQRFFDQVYKLLAEFEHNGNPFEDDSELISLVNKYKFEADAINSIRKAEEVGSKNYNEFVKTRFVEKTVKFSEKIALNNLQLLKKRPQKKVSSTQKKLQLVKSDCQLFSRLFIGAQNRKSDLADFFTFENQPFPPSISDNGHLRSGKNADIVKCFSKYYEHNKYPQECTGMVFQGADIVQMVKPSGISKTFNDYYNNDFEPYLQIIFQSYKRLDIIFDVMKKESLLSALRQEKGGGRIQRVSGDQNLPKNWNNFLLSFENNINLHQFLADKIRNLRNGFCVATIKDRCSSNLSYDHSNIAPCNHEGSDTRIFIHVRDMLLAGHTEIMIRTLDYNVIAIAISNFAKLNGIRELWISYGTKNQIEYIPIHEICSELGTKLSSCVAFFHAFTGCNTVSFFYNHGKISAFNVFKSNDNLVYSVSQYRLKEFNDLPTEIEKFVASWYDKTKYCETVNLTRKHLFVQKNRAMENLPPTKAALFQHFKRAIYQAVGIWDNALMKIFNTPSPSDWGWKEDVHNNFVPYWTTNPELSNICSELIRCGCRTTCKTSSGCSCKNAFIKCTPLCKCEGQCAS